MNTPAILAIVLLCIAVAALGIALLHKSPGTVERFENAALSFVPAVEDTLQGLLTKAELRLTSTESEDEDIEDAQRTIARANKEKAAKRTALVNHIAKLQQHLDGMSA